MQHVGKLKIKSMDKIREFLNEEHVGRIASIDDKGYPQIIPMNFVYLHDCIYMHSYHRGEKLENILQCSKVGFEVDRELEFLPSYFKNPHDASLADTLYISVVIKGNGELVADMKEKTVALNGLMAKYQPEGRYDLVNSDDKVVDAVAVIKIIPDIITGKYNIGQNLSQKDRLILAENILERNSTTAKNTLQIMGFDVVADTLKMNNISEW
ncbi:MAG: pyridoxamine 5'-phosphate oxidase family protein [Candidatus Nitrosoabyssus spongiisocia]|nr:MAG: pyridoxamine 5'-phosphate oxidase family protein [Nitrosopumilaceae archaeon AB1(1)]